MPEYTITIPDLKQYLAGLGEDDTAGICRDSTSCLLARALSWKYGGKFEASHLSFATWHSSVNHLVSEDIQKVILAFDKIGPYGSEVTRKQVEQSIPALRGE